MPRPAIAEKHEESKMPRPPQYAVLFVGYLAEVIARAKYGREVHYATLDFVSGFTAINAYRGFVGSPKRADLEPFLKSLPKLANELQGRCHREDGLSRQTRFPTEATTPTEDMIEVSFGQNVVVMSPNTKITGGDSKRLSNCSNKPRRLD
jgi:hypothetical protein